MSTPPQMGYICSALFLCIAWPKRWISQLMLCAVSPSSCAVLTQWIEKEEDDIVPVPGHQ